MPAGPRPARRPDPGSRIGNCGIRGMRGEQASGTGTLQEIRDNRARPRAGAAPGSGIAGFALAGFAGRGAGGHPGRGRSGSSGITGRDGAPVQRSDPGLRVRDCGICGMRGGCVSRFARGGRDARAPGIGEFRDNRAGRRAGAPPGSGIAGSRLRDLRDAGRLRVALRARRAGRPRTRDRGVPGQPGGAARRHRRCRRGRRQSQEDRWGGIGPCTRLRIAPSGFRERPRAEAPLADGAAGADGPGDIRTASPLKCVQSPCGRGPWSARPGTVGGDIRLWGNAPRPISRSGIDRLAGRGQYRARPPMTDAGDMEVEAGCAPAARPARRAARGAPSFRLERTHRENSLTPAGGRSTIGCGDSRGRPRRSRGNGPRAWVRTPRSSGPTRPGTR